MPVKVEITISDILDYVGERVRPIKEGEEVFKAGHIILCGTDGSNEKIIKSLCMRSSTILQSPHEVTIKLNDTWICQCSCKAGLGGYCKHIIATLIYVNRYEMLEPVSCTDLAQKWGKEKKEIEGIRSTCYSIFTYGDIRNVSDADWEVKSLKHFFPKGFSNKFTEYGLEMEKEAFELFNSKNSNSIIRPSFIISNFFPWLGFSPDGVILDGMITVKLLEIKCPYIGKSQGPEVFPESCDFLEIKNSKVELKMRRTSAVGDVIA